MQLDTKMIVSVSEANKTSAEASNAFAKVSSHADQVINSLKEITERIDNIGSQMGNIRQKNTETAVAAEKITSFCGELAEKQQSVSADVDYMNNLFLETRKEINQIKKETGDIVNRIKVVSDSSRESYKNMTDLENILEQFKTNSEVEEAVSQADEENTITTIVSPELQDAAELFANAEETGALDISEIAGFEDLLGEAEEISIDDVNGEVSVPKQEEVSDVTTVFEKEDLPVDIPQIEISDMETVISEESEIPSTTFIPNDSLESIEEFLELTEIGDELEKKD